MAETLEERIERHEGRSLKVYRDSLGYPTGGIGHRLTEQEAAEFKTGIPESVVDEWFATDVARAKAQAMQNFEWLDELSELRREVIVEMIFQLGINGVLKFKRMISALEEGDYAEAANQMIASAWHLETPARCEELAGIMRNGAAA